MTPPSRGPRQNIAIMFGVEKLEWCDYPIVKKIGRLCVFVSTKYTNVTDRQTVGPIPRDGIGSAYP